MITVQTEATTEPITVTEAKAYIGIQSTEYDAALSGAIAAARKKVEQLAGRSLVARTLKLTLHDYEDTYIELPYPVINSVTSVKTKSSTGEETTYTSADYALVHNRLYFIGNGDTVEVIYSTLANTEEFYKTAVKKQLTYDFRNEFKDNGFDSEVRNMISSVTLNTGY